MTPNRLELLVRLLGSQKKKTFKDFNTIIKIHLNTFPFKTEKAITHFERK